MCFKKYLSLFFLLYLDLVFFKRNFRFIAKLGKYQDSPYTLHPPHAQPLILSTSFSRVISVQFSHSVMPDSLQLHGLQHARLPWPSPTPWAYSNSCPSSWWVMPSNHLILCCPLLLPPSIFPSIRVFSNEFFASVYSSLLCIVKAMVFPVVMYRCESWTIRKAEHQRIDAFELWCFSEKQGQAWRWCS